MLNTNLKYVSIDFDNNGKQGLFNKIIYLSGIIRHLTKNENKNIRLVEPVYKTGSKHSTTGDGILFSNIFNIDLFNKNIKKKYNFELIPRINIKKHNDTDKKKIIINNLEHSYANIWGWNIEHEEYMNIATRKKKISINDNTLLDVLNSLELSNDKIKIFINVCIDNLLFDWKLYLNKYDDLKKVFKTEKEAYTHWINHGKKENRTCVSKYILDLINNNPYNIYSIICKKYNAIHMRIETDWPGDRNKLLEDDIIKLFNNKVYNNKKIFFSCAQNQNRIKEKWNNIGYSSFYFFRDDLSYDIKAALSYKFCLYSDIFINHSLSTFSSLINMQRELKYKNRNNKYYNAGLLLDRLDKGLYYMKNNNWHSKEASINVDIVNNLIM